MCKNPGCDFQNDKIKLKIRQVLGFTPIDRLVNIFRKPQAKVNFKKLLSFTLVYL
jgi:hypothetical protein